MPKRVKILDSQKRLIYLPTGSIYQVLSADVGNKHGLVVVAVEQDFQGKLGVRVSGFNVPTPIVVAYDFAVPFEHQLGNATTINPELGGDIKNLHPVVEDAVVNLKTSFFPHGASSSSLALQLTCVEAVLLATLRLVELEEAELNGSLREGGVEVQHTTTALLT